MTERWGHHGGELDPRASAALRGFRDEDDMPPAARERVWARVAAATAEVDAGPQRQGRSARSVGTWTLVLLAAAAAVLLTSRAGVLGPVVAERGDAAAGYADGRDRAGGEARARAAGDASASLHERERSESGSGAAGEPVAGSADGQGASGPGAGREPEGQPGSVSEGAGRGPEGRPGGPGEGVGRTSEGRPGGAGRASEGRSSSLGDGAKRETGSSLAAEAVSGGEAGSSLAAEAEALARAQAAIQGGRADEALEALAGYERRFPRGTLREEHDALRAIALCTAGRTREGRGEAQAFLRVRAGSALADRVRRTCLAE